MGENHEKIINYNKKYTKRTLLDFIRITYNNIIGILPRTPKSFLVFILFPYHPLVFPYFSSFIQ